MNVATPDIGFGARDNRPFACHFFWSVVLTAPNRGGPVAGGPWRTQQFWHDLRRLLIKLPGLQHHHNTACFGSVPMMVLASMVMAMACVPVLGAYAPFRSNDFRGGGPTMGLGRLMLMVSALDTGSPF